ncbi:MAG: hypothetical protein ACXVCJ_25880, partial [Polyangiales bacterium]
GFLVGWPLGWAEVAVRSRERGEARARLALGESPLRRVVGLWPAIALLGLVTALGSASWGRDARAPGRVARALIAEAREACVKKTAPEVVDVPLVRASFLCRPGKAPLLAAEGAGNAAAIDFLASDLDIADDLGSLSARDVQVLLPPPSSVRMHFLEARVRGLAPFSAPSSVKPLVRAALIVGAATLCAMLVAAAALRRTAGHRAVDWMIALAGPSATLAALRACERGGIADARLLVVPLAAAFATVAAELAVAAIARWRYARLAR